MRKIVGIDRKIKRAWLDATLDRLAQTGDEAELRSFLDKHLKDELPGKESRAKSSGVILRIWSGIPPERAALRDRAVALLPRISGQERIWLHWGMTALAYPFFRDTAEVVGRLLALQDDFTTAQVQDRMLTSWGDRATSKEAAQKLVTMLVDWEVLRATKTKGYFLLARKMTTSMPDLQLWLLEAILGASSADEIEARQLLRLPESFPFNIGMGLADLRRHEGFNIHRQGLDMDMVSLHKMKLAPPSKTNQKLIKKKPATVQASNLFGSQSVDVNLVEGNGKAATLTSSIGQAAGNGRSDFEERRRNAASMNKAIRQIPKSADPQLEAKPAPQVAHDHLFAASSAECAEQYQHGRYLACIALAQATVDTMIQHIWQTQVQRQKNQKSSFEKNVEALYKNNFITAEWKAQLDQMWLERHAFHQMSEKKSGTQTIERMAGKLLKLLHQLQEELFESSMRVG